jgi:hypothetical protein
MIRHPNLVEIYELGQVGADLFLVMEYRRREPVTSCAGSSRETAMAQRSPWSPRRARFACGPHVAHRQAARGRPSRRVAVEYLVTYTGNVKVLDFDRDRSAPADLDRHRPAQQGDVHVPSSAAARRLIGTGHFSLGVALRAQHAAGRSGGRTS